MQGFFVTPTVKAAYARNFKLTRDSEKFIDAIDSEINRRKITNVRIHASGDFYNEKYMSAWFRIARMNPSVKFYAYTKMISMFKRNYYFVPDNFKVIFSLGGKQDILINKLNDAHSMVFDSIESLNAAGYIDTSHDAALASQHQRIGLVFHGRKSTAWNTQGWVS